MFILTWILSLVSLFTIASPGVSGTSVEPSATPLFPYSLSVPAPLFRLGVSGTCSMKYIEIFKIIIRKHYPIILLSIIANFQLPSPTKVYTEVHSSFLRTNHLDDLPLQMVSFGEIPTPSSGLHF